MWERIKCPSCSAGLILQESARGSGTTCPRCLAMVSAPETGREPGAIQAERPERREGAFSCPRCGRTMEAIWITCPWCEEPLRGRERGRYGAADLDVRRDTKRTSCLVIVLAVIGGLSVSYVGGMALFGSVGGALLDPNFDQYSTLLFWACFLIPLLFLAGVSTLIVFVRSRGNPGAIGFRRVAVGTLALAGAVILVGLLLCLAFLVFVFIDCNLHPAHF
jgi:ssDNA-binding Zn-finger/Zn-ribbon topoisomerase 1